MESDKQKFRRSMHTYFERLRQEKQKNEKQRKEIISGHYDKVREIEFQHIGPEDMVKHFRFPILEGGCDWPLTARAVFPVLCSRSDFINPEAWTQISRENIAKLAGLSPMAVDKGLQALREININNKGSLLTAEKVQHGRRRFFRYQLYFNRGEEEVKYFIFYNSLIISGIWADLSLRAKGMYIALRETAYFDRDLFIEISEIEQGTSPKSLSVLIECPFELEFGIDVDQYEACDKCQLWEECRNAKAGGSSFKWLVNPLPVTELCRNANISTSHCGEVIKELEQAGLVENFDQIRIVHLHSTNHIKQKELH